MQEDYFEISTHNQTQYLDKNILVKHQKYQSKEEPSKVTL